MSQQGATPFQYTLPVRAAVVHMLQCATVAGLISGVGAGVGKCDQATHAGRPISHGAVGRGAIPCM